MRRETTKSRRRRNGPESGQVLVEAAFVLPLYLVLMLCMLQLGLMHQAQMVTKYAAYRAARAGAMHHADRWSMMMAASQVTLPKFAGRRLGVGGIIPGIGGHRPTRLYVSPNAPRWALNYGQAWLNVFLANDVPPALVLLCGPTRRDVDGGGSFDDPELASSSGGDYDRTKLRVQVVMPYRMPIPLAGQMLAPLNNGHILFNRVQPMGFAEDVSFAQESWQRHTVTNVLLGNILNPSISNILVTGWLFQILADMNPRGATTVITAGYSMRMMSDINHRNLPRNNECFL